MPGPSNVVVDASAVVELLVDAVHATCLRDYLRTFRVLHAPHLIDVEVLQFIRNSRLRDEVDDARASMAIVHHLALPIKRYAHQPFLLRAWELHANITAYDAIYVALAEALRATLVTSDARLAKAAKRFVAVERP